MDNTPIWVTTLGFIAATFTTFGSVPQAIKVYKTKETKDLSLWMFLMFSVGTLLWLIYGVFRRDIVLIVANTITFSFVFYIFLMKLFNVIKYKEKP